MTTLLGSTSAIESGSDNISGQHFIATKAVASATGIADLIAFQIDSASTATGTLQLAIYDSSGTGGGPGARVGNAVNASIGTNGSTRYVSGTGASASLSSGSTYWIAAVWTGSSAADWLWGDATGTGGTGGTANGLAFTAGAVGTSLPTTFPAFSLTSETANAYAQDAGVSPNDPLPIAEAHSTFGPF